MGTGFRLLLALLCVWGAWQSWKYREQDQPPGVRVPDAPQQTELPEGTPLIRHGEYTLVPRAEYDLRARLLSRRRYFMGRGTHLTALDFAVGWGPMSDSTLLDTLDWSQSGRFFHVSWPDASQAGLVMRHAANVHLIAADAQVERRLDAMRRGQLIRLRGLLVDASSPSLGRWPTSLTRDDEGPGACELLWVRDAEVIGP